MERIAGLFRRAALGAAVVLAGAGGAAAQGAGEWHFQVTPYVWATGLGADLTFGAARLSIDKSFSEVLRDLDSALFLSAFARNDRLVFLGDLTYSSSSRKGLVPPGIPAEGRLRQTSLTLAAGYRVSATPGATVDLLAGIRHWRVTASGRAPAAGLSESRRANFTDPILAARINAQLAPRWSTLIYADVGGFGVGSEFTGQILATVNYAVSDRTTLSAGYRHLVVDYRSGPLRVDARLSGPIFGATFRF